MRVRSAAHRRALRFRVHRRDLPGTPDLVFPKWRIAIFVHGCFWHRHPGCKKAGTPKSRVDFWTGKFDRNVERDRENFRVLADRGWRVEVIWECETKVPHLLSQRLDEIFGSTDREPA
jgi:DNA mismatch endonuclease (patch repair protein)